jgi:hypothetical protein
MLTTDFLALYKQITSGVYEYLMFLALMMMLYLFIGAMVKLITDCIIKIVLSIRAPITTKFETVEEEV